LKVNKIKQMPKNVKSNCFFSNYKQWFTAEVKTVCKHKYFKKISTVETNFVK